MAASFLPHSQARPLRTLLTTLTLNANCSINSTMSKEEWNPGTTNYQGKEYTVNLIICISYIKLSCTPNYRILNYFSYGKFRVQFCELLVTTFSSNEMLFVL